jgi:hypothetical protein
VLFQFVVPHSKGKETPTAAGGHQVFIVKGRDHGRHLQREKKEKKEKKKEKKKEREEEREERERRKRKKKERDIERHQHDINTTST